MYVSQSFLLGLSKDEVLECAVQPMERSRKDHFVAFLVSESKLLQGAK